MKEMRTRGLWGYFALTFGVSWLIWATPVMGSLGWIESPVINTSLSLFPPIEQRAGGNHMALTYLALAYVVVAVVLVAREPGWWLKGPAAASGGAN